MTERVAELEGLRIPYVETGAGAGTVVYLGEQPEASAQAAFLGLLGASFRTLAPRLDACDDAAADAESLAAFVRHVASGPVHVIAHSDASAITLWLAVLPPELVDRLALLAPTALVDTQPGRDELMARLPEVEALTLVIWGTEDALGGPGSSAALYHGLVARSHTMYVYGAGHDLPSVAAAKCAGLVTDLFERGDLFIINPGG